jgi:hypothetical protein
MDCEHGEHRHTLRPSRLYAEALSVGVLLVPVWWAVMKATAAVKISGDAKPYVDVAVAGFLFHIAAEESGVNAWYLTHSYAAEKVLFPKQKNDILGCVGHLWRSGDMDLHRERRAFLRHWRRNEG